MKKYVFCVGQASGAADLFTATWRLLLDVPQNELQKLLNPCLELSPLCWSIPTGIIVKNIKRGGNCPKLPV